MDGLEDVLPAEEGHEGAAEGQDVEDRVGEDVADRPVLYQTILILDYIVLHCNIT